MTRYDVFGYATDVAHTQMVQTDDGNRHGMLMTMVIAYDQQGKPLNSILNTQKLDLEPKVYRADALRTGAAVLPGAGYSEWRCDDAGGSV